MWIPFPDEPPVRRITKGHYYNVGDQVLAEFKHRSNTRIESLSNYDFIRLATNGIKFTTTTVEFNSMCLHKLQIKEVPIQDFPLYINWYTLPPFIEILNTGKRKTRTFSKSSKLSSSR